jgi:hypothetical protein
MTKNDKKRMLESVKQGEKFVKFAMEFKLSRQRIGQIIHQNLTKQEIKKIREIKHEQSRERQRILNRKYYYLKKKNGKPDKNTRNVNKIPRNEE